ncbi:MAG: PQQ-binding-like beta-propeller repeat protein [Sandaracinus sp.]|nr:PQQ-binding-like beta-propeller repeat protein [Sandaracinus sp.]MCB9618867.1 PQQ-binding-like beta-propeller repeat protein [Sandaracinus sp.]
MPSDEPTTPPERPAPSAPRRTVLLVAMWLGAAGAMLVLWLGRDDEASLRAPAAAPGLTVPGEAAPAPTTPPDDADWPEGPPRQFRGDRRHTGRSAYVGPRAAELAWRHETTGRITAQPVVGPEGEVYVADHGGTLHALTPYGRERWSRELGGPIYSTPFVDDQGNVYVGSDARAISSFTSEGDLRWRLPTEGDADTGLTQGPNGRLHVAAGAELFALERDGTVRWSFRASGKIFTTPAIADDGTIYVGSQDDHLYAISPDGELRWSYRTEDDNDSSPAIGDDGTVYFGSDDRKVYALAPDGTLRWSAAMEGMVRAPVGLGPGGAVYVGVFGPRPRVVCLDAADGHERWHFGVTVADTTEIGVASGPLVDRAGNVYFGAHDDYLYSLAPTGELRWAFEANADVDSSPALAPDGTLYFGSDDRHLYALRAP